MDIRIESNKREDTDRATVTAVRYCQSGSYRVKSHSSFFHPCLAEDILIRICDALRAQELRFALKAPRQPPVSVNKYATSCRKCTVASHHSLCGGLMIEWRTNKISLTASEEEV